MINSVSSDNSILLPVYFFLNVTSNEISDSNARVNKLSIVIVKVKINMTEYTLINIY